MKLKLYGWQRIMFVIYELHLHNKEITQTTICRYLGVNVKNISRIIMRLLDEKYIFMTPN